MASAFVNSQLLMTAAGAASAAFGIHYSYPFMTFCGSVFALSGVIGIVVLKHFQSEEMQNIFNRMNHSTPYEIREREEFILLLRLDQAAKEYAASLYANRDQDVDQRAFDAFYKQFEARVAEIAIPTISREFIAMHYSLERLLIKNYFKYRVEDLPHGIRPQIFNRALKSMIDALCESGEMAPAAIVKQISYIPNLFSSEQIHAELNARKRLIKLI